jgi:hypothetical protein
LAITDSGNRSIGPGRKIEDACCKIGFLPETVKKGRQHLLAHRTYRLGGYNGGDSSWVASTNDFVQIIRTGSLFNAWCDLFEIIPV